MFYLVRILHFHIPLCLAPSPLPMLEMLLRLTIHPAVLSCPLLHLSQSSGPLRGLLDTIIIVYLVPVPAIMQSLNPCRSLSASRSTSRRRRAWDLAVGFWPSSDVGIGAPQVYIYYICGEVASPLWWPSLAAVKNGFRDANTKSWDSSFNSWDEALVKRTLDDVNLGGRVSALTRSLGSR